MENYVKAVLYAYPTLEKMEQAYTVHIRNMAVLSYRQDLPAVAMAGKIVGQILQKRKLAWLKALVEKSVRRLSDEEKESRPCGRLIAYEAESAKLLLFGFGIVRWAFGRF